MPRTPSRVEWPTIAVATAIYALFAAAFVAYSYGLSFASGLLFVVAGAWYGSLQHEVVHGHPTPWNAVNVAIGAMPLGLIFPFAEYRRTHLIHHDDQILTDPLLDPESHYVSSSTWEQAHPLTRKLLTVQTTLIGFLTVGAVHSVVTFWVNAVKPSNPDRLPLAVVVRHVIGVSLILITLGTLGVPIWFYIATFGYGGLAATLLRSFAEHRAADSGSQSAVIAAGPVMSLLFLNNNLHYTHHLSPGAAWFAIPELHRQSDGVQLALDGAGFYAGGYKELMQKFAFRSSRSPVHPHTK